MMHKVRRRIWKLFHPILSRLGYSAEGTEDRSIFYIQRPPKITHVKLKKDRDITVIDFSGIKLKAAEKFLKQIKDNLKKGRGDLFI